MTVIRFASGERVDVIDADCEFRPCFWLGFDKGSFTPGVGYTRYHEGGPRAVCWTRHLKGCPHVGVHLKCGTCHRTIGDAVPIGEERETPGACPECGSWDLYWLADVLEPPRPCCDKPDVPNNSRAYRQRCRSCGTWLRGKRLAAARSAA